MMYSRILQLQDFLKEDPSDVFSRFALALEYLKVDDKNNALKQLELLHVEYPDYLATYYQLGKVLESNGQAEAAIRIFEQGKIIAKNQRNQRTYNELNSAIDALKE
jgi:tetratricopeptide (TPR) repeat protein